ncbi:MAG: hypothetical protein L0G99_16175, partial [Propionibacteriales bacterium]|nr:hypothetical protein [Propionibacteriales bacterium]
MSTSPHDDRDVRTAWWKVLSIFDPDGDGIDFAYTVGLHDRGFPELHLWARPDRGTDPGADWMFSNQDRTSILNEVAWRLVEGELSVGDEWQQELDMGASLVHFRLEPPGDPEHLEAFQIDDEATVLPVSWSLERTPEGQLAPLDDAALADAAAELTAVVSDIRPDFRPDVVAPPGWELADAVVAPDPTDPPTYPPSAFDPEQRFGPRTPFILARAAMLWVADANDWISLSRCLKDAERFDPARHPLGLATGAARLVGRTAALQASQQAADDLIELIMSGRWAEQWQQYVAWFAPSEAEAQDPEWQAEASETLATLFRHHARILFAVEVVADQLPDWVLLWVRGPWVTGLCRDGDVPGPEWVASDTVMAQLVAALAPLSLAELRDLPAQNFEFAEQDDDYRVMVNELHGGALTGFGGCPRAALMDLPALAGHADAQNIAAALQPFASVLTMAMGWGVDRTRRDLLVRGHGGLLPWLADLPTPDEAMGR